MVGHPRNQRGVEGDDIGLLQQLLQGLGLLAAVLGKELLGFGGGIDQNPHAQRLEQGHHGLWNVSKEHHAEGKAGQAVHGVAHQRGPVPGPDALVVIGDFAGQVDGQADGVHRHLLGTKAGGVGQADAQLGGAGLIQIVGADGLDGYDLQLGALLHNRLGDLLVLHHQAVGVLQILGEFSGGLVFNLFQLHVGNAPLPQQSVFVIQVIVDVEVDHL
ncbi:hypothetical protein SDC9_103342 [bioreactor metagenome]|uniref:NAD-specific glutamate dehydrogenase n=1 Tax=bioreactor metagenome TaxID=1076179 RepID=A0A645AUJ0_9ZZZZ